MGTIDADPVKEGLVASLPRPGGNITGQIGIAWELAGKRLELLKVENAFRLARDARAEALFVVSPGMLNSHRPRIAALAIEARLPSIASNVEFVADGGLMGCAPNLAEQFRRVATYVDKILKGAKPSDLPIEQPTKFELVVNAKTAKAIGVTIPRSILARADRVIE